jgi:hypothetical protein
MFTGSPLGFEAHSAIFVTSLAQGADMPGIPNITVITIPIANDK